MKEAFLISLKVVEDLNELLRDWWIWIESIFCLKMSFCLGLKWMLEKSYFFSLLSAFISSMDARDKSGLKIELLEIIKRVLNTVKKSWKLAVTKVFVIRGQLMGSTSA